MEFLQVTLILATFLCSLVAGFLFAFSIVVMPGIKTLGNREYIRAFQAIDGIIQNNQPVFMLVWPGSIITLIIATALGFGQLDAAGRWLLVLSAVAYLSGVQLPTFTINVPLNNRLQSLTVDTMGETECEAERKAFEGRWNHWNGIRTVVSCLVSLLLMFLLIRY